MEIEWTDQVAQPILSIRVKTPLKMLPQLIGQNYMKIMEYLGKIGAEPAGAPFTAYYNLDMENLDVEMGFPVAAPLPGSGEILAGEIKSGKVVSALYKGPYAGMESAYNEIFRVIAESQVEMAGVYYEYYFNSPDEVPESELLTKIVIPLK